MKDRMTYRLDRRGKLLKQCIREMYGFNSPSDDDIDRDAFADWAEGTCVLNFPQFSDALHGSCQNGRVEGVTNCIRCWQAFLYDAETDWDPQDMDI